MNKSELIIKYCNFICEAIDEHVELFCQRIELIKAKKYGSAEFQALEYKLMQLDRNIKELANQALKIL